MAKGKSKKKGRIVKIAEYLAAYSLVRLSAAAPLRLIHLISNLLGHMLYAFVPRRRNIALENIRQAFKGIKSEDEIKDIALQSFKSFFLTFLEISKFSRLYMAAAGSIDKVMAAAGGFDELFHKAKEAHDKSGGCLFVTPHIGSWELLPHIGSAAGIPLVIVARPTDNEYLERLIYRSRSASGQVIIPKKNAFFILQKVLRSGKSIGMLPDQSTAKGIVIDFFDRRATATPMPALLAIRLNRPVVVVACCRKGNYSFDWFVCDPIWPRRHENEKEEIFRLTKEINKNMEDIIRRYPGQYLWMHNRWKTYKDQKEFLSCP